MADRPSDPCERCKGTGYDPEPAGLPETNMDGRCQDCDGHGSVLRGVDPD